MNVAFRPVNMNDAKEVRFIAEADARIPLEYDSSHTFAESSIDARLDYYNQLATDDFFEVAIADKSVVAFHIVKKIPYPPNFHVGSIISLWVHPDYRNKGLAAQLKTRAEQWAKDRGMIFMQTNVHKSNSRMLAMNQSNGYETVYINLRKKL